MDVYTDIRRGHNVVPTLAPISVACQKRGVWLTSALCVGDLRARKRPVVPLRLGDKWVVLDQEEAIAAPSGSLFALCVEERFELLAAHHDEEARRVDESDAL